MNLWLFFQNQVLGMQWLNTLVGNLLTALGLDTAAAPQLERYAALLLEKNKVMNLTAITEPAAVAQLHFLDCIALLDFADFRGKRVVDVGCGAGFPGVPVAIMRPDIHVTLMDALGKRVAFLKEVVAALGLNADCVHARCEDAAKKPEFRDAYDVACARAVAETNVLSEWLLPFVKPGGRMLALKGPMAAEEAARAQTALAQLNGRLARVCPVSVPGRDWDHRVIEILKTGATPDRFPRRAGIAEKRPLK